MTGLEQARPASEAQAQAFSDAWVFAETHPDDVGYPWIDPLSQRLELSAVSGRSSALLQEQTAAFEMATQVREVAFSFGQLEAIKHEITTLNAAGVPDADLIFQTAPDHRNNRVVVTVIRASDRLFEELVARYGTEAIAVQIDPSGPGGSVASRKHDSSPFWGGAEIYSPNRGVYCSDSFGWWLSSPSKGDALLTAAHCAPTGGFIKINGVTVGQVTSSRDENWSTTYGTQYYTGDTSYRGDVALIRLDTSYTSGTKIYRGGPDSTSSSYVVGLPGRYSLIGDRVYVGGAKTGETGIYYVNAQAIDWWYSDDGPNVWVRNVARASANSGPCVDHGDSGGSVFSVVGGGVVAVGTFSGFAISKCNALYTDTLRTMGAPFPGDVRVYH